MCTDKVLYQFRTATGQVVNIRSWEFGSGRTVPQGPITILGGIHGDEPASVAVCLNLVKELKILYSSGARCKRPLRIIACVNPLALLVDERCSPVERADWNRVLADEDGLLGERIVDAIVADVSQDEVAPEAIIDIHGGNRFLRRVPEVLMFPDFLEQTGDEQSRDVRRRSFNIATQLRLPLIRIESLDFVSQFTRTLVCQLSKATGAVPLVIELGGGDRIYAGETTRLVECILAMSGAIDAPELTPESPNVVPIRMYASESLRVLPAPRGGLFVPQYTQLCTSVEPIRHEPLEEGDQDIEAIAGIPDERFLVVTEDIPSVDELMVAISHELRDGFQLLLSPTQEGGLRIGSFKGGDLYGFRPGDILGHILCLETAEAVPIRVPQGGFAISYLTGIRRHPLVYEGSDLAMLVGAWIEVGFTEPFI
ncbi:MAG: succinylglutamate desuccinylase/aspartoacylase family protein [Dehalococcoidia bacterium]